METNHIEEKESVDLQDAFLRYAKEFSKSTRRVELAYKTLAGRNLSEEERKNMISQPLTAALLSLSHGPVKDDELRANIENGVVTITAMRQSYEDIVTKLENDI